MGIQERRERERAARRKSMLDATRELVRERGFVGTTTRAIAKRCEVSEATVFFHFGSKDEVLTSLLFEGIEFMRQGLEQALEDDRTPAECVAWIWTFFEEVRSEHPEYLQVFAHLAHPQSTASVSDEVKHKIGRASAENLRMFRQILDEVVGPERSRVATDLVWAAFFGLGLLHDSRANLGAPSATREGDLRIALDLLLTGISPGGGKS